MESAQRALQEPSRMIDGRLAVCNLACEGLSSSSSSTDVALRKIYIGGLSPEISSETLLNFFGRHGEIEEGSVAYDKATNRSRGFGFVTFKTVEDAKKAIDDPNKTLGGRNITVKLADSPRSKVIQAQAPAAMVPVALAVPMGYTQPVESQIGSTIGYSPHSSMAAYPSSFPYAPAQYPQHSQLPYSQLSGKREPAHLPVSAPAGVSGYPHYPPKQ